MTDKCDVCGHETNILDHGTGKYAEKMVCGLCEYGNFSEQLLRVEIAELREELKSFAIFVFRLDKTLDTVMAAKVFRE